MSLNIRAVIERAVEFEALIVLRSEIFHVPQYHALAVCARFALQLHMGHFTATQLGFNDVAGTADLNCCFLNFQLAPFESVGLKNHGRQRITLSFACGRVERNRHPLSFFVGAPLVPEISCEPILGSSQIRIARVPFTYLYRNIAFAMRVLGVLIEVARTKQVATAGFDVIGLHLPGGLCGSGGHEDEQTEREKTYLPPASHIHLLSVIKFELMDRSCLF